MDTQEVGKVQGDWRMASVETVILIWPFKLGKCVLKKIETDSTSFSTNLLKLKTNLSICPSKKQSVLTSVYISTPGLHSNPAAESKSLNHGFGNLMLDRINSDKSCQCLKVMGPGSRLLIQAVTRLSSTEWFVYQVIISVMMPSVNTLKSLCSSWRPLSVMKKSCQWNIKYRGRTTNNYGN